MSITSPQGFVAAGHSCGIKASGALDLAVVATAAHRPVAAAGVFTSNKATAAPVAVSRAHLGATGGRAAAVVLSSGNANAATGPAGRADAHRMCALVASGLGCRPTEVLVCSTGLIGIPLPMDRLEEGIPAVVQVLRADGGEAAATAIMTTDTARKEVVVAGEGFTVGGMAKGAAMLAPNMATMLAVLTTDAAATPEQLQEALSDAMATSFNALSTDGCTSTNDTVLLLASGAAGEVDPADLHLVVAEACADLARQMAHDAEGATKVVTVRVVGATSDEGAEAAARKVADSALCKCSWYGEDAYWGRIVSELGSCRAPFDEAKVSVSYGGITVCRDGVAAMHDVSALQRVMAAREITVVADLGLGEGTATILTNDLTHAYVDENMGTS
ncbi:MAG: bifunctional glutamate N-acetyltransferase/amino-acid acetyltransferase ArgJ [Acidimicrobiales bacterium]